MRRAFVLLLSSLVAAAAVALPGGTAHAIDPPKVRVTPGVSSVVAGGTRQLTATVTGLENTAVTWSVRSGPGSVSAAGLYTAPATAPAARPVAVLRAASVEDSTLYGEAAVTVASGVAANGFGASVAVTEGAYKARAGDVNGDGAADIVRLQGLANDIKVFRFVTMLSDGSGGFTESVSATGSVYTLPDGFTKTNDYIGDFELADLDGDGDLDIVIAFGSHSSQTYREQLWRNNGSGTWTPETKVLADAGGSRSGPNMHLTDFDGDGHLDMVRLDPFGTVQLQKGTGTGTFGTSTSLFSTTGSGRDFAVGDLTGDGRPEVVVGTQTSQFAVERTFEVAVNDGFGNIAGETTYTAGLNPSPTIYDATGDGWNDIVAAVGGDGATNDPPKTMVHANLGTGTGAVATTGTQVFAFRPYGLYPVHVDGDDVLDLAGTTFRGPFLARRTGSNAFSAVHAGTTFSSTDIAPADATGDGRVDVYAANDYESRFFPGAADGTLAFAIDPTVTHVNATKNATFTATVRNAPSPVAITWTASRGTWVNDFFATSSRTYTAPSTAAPEGTAVRITATLPGVPSATRDITVFNDRYQAYSLGGQQVRQVVRDPASATTLYAATASGVYRSTTSGATFQLLGTTGTTGTDAKQVAVARDGAVAQLVAVFGTTVYRYDLATPTDWTAAGVTGAAGVSAAPGTAVVYAAAGNQVHRSTDGGTTWAALGGTSVNGVEAIDATNVWVRRSVAPRVNVGTYDAGALTVTARALPADTAVTALAADPADRATAYAAAGSALYRGDAATGTWTALPVPAAVDALSVAPGTGHILAADAGTNTFWKSRDGGASWYDANRGFPTTLQSVAHRADGLDLVGTSSGLYVPVATTGPAAPEITGGPTGTTSPGGANAFSFPFTGTGSSYLCSLDNATWAACTSPKTYSGPLGEGSHTFAVVAVDADGDESLPATRTWTVDATPPPVPEITSGPTGVVASTSAAFEFTLSGDAAGAVCALDNGAFTSCTSPKSYTGLSQAQHTFAVRSVDAYGNQSGSATRTWTPDVTPPPAPNIYTAPQYYSPSASAFFGWTTTGGATYTCQLDSAPVACASSSYSVSGLSEGWHSFAVFAADAVGNMSSDWHDWTVDLTAPATPQLTTKPDAETLATTATFAFSSSSNDVNGYYCSLDGGAAQWCWGEATYSGLSVGAHTFTVFARDYAGWSSTSATYNWTVTAPPPPPAPEITGGPTGLVASRTAAFTYTVGDGLSAKCSLNGAEPASCPSTGKTYTDLADGSYTFSVYAVSAQGVLSTAATRTWQVDGTAPTAPVLTKKPPTRTSATSSAFDWNAVGGETYTCVLDGSPVTCGPGTYAASVGEGTHTFAISAQDAAGNHSGTTTHTWTVDVTGPAPVIATKPAVITKSTAAVFTVTSDAADLAGFACTLDDAPVDCADGSVDEVVAHGTHTFQVVASDDVGNTGSATHTWTVDTQAPATPVFTTKPAARTNTPVGTFDWAAEAGAVYGCTLDNQPVACGDDATYTLPQLADGGHLFVVTATDAAGNAATPASYDWVVDTTAPTPVIDGKPPVTTKETSASFTVSAAATDLEGFECTLDSEPVDCADGTVEVTGLDSGPHDFQVWASDDLGNTGTATYEWWVDLSAVGISIGTPGSSLTAPRYVYFDQPAYGVSTTSVRLLTGVSTSVPFSLVCRDNANVPVSCATSDNVRDAVLTPAAPLMPGQHYTIKVSGILDDVGNVAPPVSSSFRASTLEQETTVGAKATWRKVASSAAQGGSYSLTDLRGASASYAFTGTSVTFYGAKGPSFGKADLFIDNETKPRATVSYYSSSAGSLGKTISGLTKAKHTLRVVVRGEKGSTSGTGTNVGVDAVKVGSGATSTSPVFTYAWARRAASTASGGAYALEDNAGATYTVKFRGTAFTWVTALGPSMGKATVKIDSRTPVTVDNYASAAKYGYARKFSGLTDAVHTVTITVLGQRRSGAKGTYVVFDRFGLT